MKHSLFIILFFFLLLISINSKKPLKENKEKESSNEKEESNSREEAKETSESQKEKENHMMTDEEFEEKLQKILEEKRIRKNTKITKDKLKEIFEAIYEKDFLLPDLPTDLKEEEGKEEIDPKEESKRFLNEMFFKLARSLDYDDEITPNQIKEYISPKRVQVVVGEIVESLIGMMGDL